MKQAEWGVEREKEDSQGNQEGEKGCATYESLME